MGGVFLRGNCNVCCVFSVLLCMCILELGRRGSAWVPDGIVNHAHCLHKFLVV